MRSEGASRLSLLALPSSYRKTLVFGDKNEKA